MRAPINSLFVLAGVLSLALDLFAQAPCFDRAMQTFREHQWVGAADAFKACENEHPHQTSSLLYRGKALVNLGKFDDAAVALQDYRKTNPRSDDATYLLAFVRFRQNRPRESLQLFNDAAQLHAPTADDLKVIGLDYVLLADYEHAGRYLEQSLSIDPDNIETRYHLGRVRYQQNRFDLAIAAFQEVLRRDPHNVKAEDNLGLSLEATNQVEEALASYRQAIEFDEGLSSHSAQPYLNMGTLLAKSGQPESAVAPLTRAAAIAPNLGKVHYQLAKAYFDLNRFDDAGQEAEKAIRIDPNDSANHYLLGRIYRRCGKSEQSKAQFRITEQLIHVKNSNVGGMASAPQ